jgi:hypothetical protein
MVNDTMVEVNEETNARIKELEKYIKNVNKEVKDMHQDHIKLATSFRIVKLV